MITFCTGKERELQHHFTAANKECDFVTRINNRLLIMAGVTHCGGPLVIIAFNYWMGTLTPELWVHPFKGM